MSKNKKMLIFVVPILLGSLLLSYMILANSPKTSLASTCGKFGGNDFNHRTELASCVKEYINASVTKYGAIETERDIINSVKKIPEINYVCHPYAHAVGKQALIETNDIVKAVKESTSYCAWGYLHGMNVQATEMYQGQKLFDVVMTGCNEVKKLNGNPYECAHGMGDAFDTKENGDIYKALLWCDKIVDEGMHLNCSQGAVNNWADWYVVDYQKHAPEKLSDLGRQVLNNAPYSACEAITDKIDRSACFNYSSRINNSFKAGLNGWNKYCDAYEGDDNAYCYQGLGREWVFIKTLPTNSAIRNCMKAKTDFGVEICTEEYINTKTQIMRDRKGDVLKSICDNKEFATSVGVTQACKVSVNALKSYFDGTFQL